MELVAAGGDPGGAPGEAGSEAGAPGGEPSAIGGGDENGTGDGGAGFLPGDFARWLQRVLDAILRYFNIDKELEFSVSWFRPSRTFWTMCVRD